MKKWFDSTMFECPTCGHTWILRSNKVIPLHHFEDWTKNMMKEHLDIVKGKK